MKILLLIPNSKKTAKSIPLGVLYVAAALREAGFSQIKIVDARIQRLGLTAIAKKIKEFSPHLVGISGLSCEAREVHGLASLVKEGDDRLKVVVGGAYASASPDLVMQDPHVDFAVIGEGERVMCNLTRALCGNMNFADIDGLAYRNEGTVVIKQPKTMIEDLDTMPLPAWDLIDLEQYFNTMHRHSENPVPVSERIVPVFTSRGCPYRCTYCHNIFGKRTRLRSAQGVLQEIKTLVDKYNIGEVEIVDDVFNFDIARAKQICDLIASSSLTIKLSFPNGLRIDNMDEELIIKLKQAGTHFISYAIETASPRLQINIRKNLNFERAKETIHQTVRQGIFTNGFFMFGFPRETKEEMLQTIRFAKEAPLHTADFVYVTPYPGTELYDELRLGNVNLNGALAANFFKLSVNATSISDRELKNILATAYRAFYLRVSLLLRLWKLIPKKTILIRNFILVLRRSLFATS